jgi:hypothetical protein
VTTPEGRVKDKVRKALKSLEPAYSFMPVQNGMGAPGLDWYCCVYGQFVAIETKVPGKKITPRQRQTALAIKRAHGTVFVIRDQDDINHMMGLLSRPLIFGAMIYDKLWWDPPNEQSPVD